MGRSEYDCSLSVRSRLETMVRADRGENQAVRDRRKVRTEISGITIAAIVVPSPGDLG